VTTNILVDLELTSSDSGSSGWTDIADMSAAAVVAGAGSVLLIIGTVMPEMTSSDETAAYRLTVDGSPVGPQPSKFVDNEDEGNGVCLAWAVTGFSGSTTFAMQWQNVQGTAAIDTSRARTFQVIEFTQDCEILVSLTSTAAGSLTGSFAAVPGLSDTQVAAAGATHLFIGSLTPLSRHDDTGDLQFAVDGVQDGPQGCVTTDATDEMDAWTSMWVQTGIASGSRTFAVYGQNRTSELGFNETYARGFQVLEFTGADVNLITDIELTSASSAPASWGTMTGMTDTQTPDSASSVLLAMAAWNLLDGVGNTDDSADFMLAFGGSREGAQIVNWTDDEDRVAAGLLARAKTGVSASTAFELQWQDLNNDPQIDTNYERTFQVLEFEAVAAAAPPPFLPVYIRRSRLLPRLAR